MRRLFFLSTQDVSSKLGWIWKSVSRALGSRAGVPSDVALATPGDQPADEGSPPSLHSVSSAFPGWSVWALLF